MNTELVFSFLSNVLILMGVSVIYSLFPSDSKLKLIHKQIIMGLIVILIGVTLMGTAFSYDSGIFYDARSVIISVTGMFLGYIPALIGIVGLSIARIILGGTGALAGTLSIVFSGAVGIAWRYFRLKKSDQDVPNIRWYEFYIVGILVSLSVILAQLFLPSAVLEEVIPEVSLALLVIYPVGQLLISIFMMTQRERFFQSQKTIASEKQFRSLFNESKTILFLLNPSDGRFIDVNKEAIRKYGYSLEEFQAMTISDINPMPRDEMIALMKKAKDKQQNVFHFQHRIKNGKLLDVEVHSGPIVINNQTYLYSTIIDVTETLKQRRKFVDIDEKFKTTLLSIGEGVIVTDGNGIITMVNAPAMRLANFTQMPIHKHLSEVFELKSHTGMTLSDIFEQVNQTRETYSSSDPFILRQEGTNITLYVDFTLAPITSNEDLNHGTILIVRDMSMEVKKQQEIRYISQHDHLTGLYNRYFFETELYRLDTERQLPLSIIMGDVNGLKLLNDTFSHMEGDKLLVEVAKILKLVTRHEDIVARWGGDEFVILLPQTDEDTANLIYNRIKQKCASSSYKVIQPSVSLGIATKRNMKLPIYDVIKLAEEQMYREKLQEGKSMRNSLISTLENTLVEKSLETKEHATNIVELSRLIAQEIIHLTQDQINTLTLAARLHDIGKIGISDVILQKNGSLDEEEWEQIKLHPEIGSRIVQNIPELSHISDSILHHHERWDGTGYPHNLEGDSIPLFSRIITIADSYEVMTNGRIYKPKIVKEEALLEIKNQSGKQFDPTLASLFIDLMNKHE